MVSPSGRSCPGSAGPASVPQIVEQDQPKTAAAGRQQRNRDRTTAPLGSFPAATMTTIQDKTCQFCGEPFTRQGRGRPRSFCTDDCRIRHHRARRKPSGKQPRHHPRLPGFPPVTWAPLSAVPDDPVVITAPNRQIPLFPTVRDLSRYDTELHAEPGNPVLAAAAHRLAGIAEERGWSAAVEAMTRQGLLTVLSGRVEGEPVPRTEVNQLPALKIPAVRVAEVLADLGLLIDDQAPAIRQWIDRRADELPAGFRDDVRDWLIWLHEERGRRVSRGDVRRGRRVPGGDVRRGRRVRRGDVQGGRRVSRGDVRRGRRVPGGDVRRGRRVRRGDV
ncbi:MAG: hypothetical protein JWL97_4377, partial [Gemmatimonadales bacterium]|nr:hypothetical protein [Gemmatimonadales bacterium]